MAFRIALRDGEPFLLACASGLSISPAEHRLKKELTRIAEYEAAGLFDADDKDGIYASIWDNPHLLSFMDANCRVGAPDGQQISFSDDAAYAVLRISESDDSKIADMKFLVLAADEEQTPDVLLDDTHDL